MGIKVTLVLGILLIRPVLAISYLPDFISVAGEYSACRLFNHYGYDSGAWCIGLSAIRFYNLNELTYWGGDISKSGWMTSCHWMSWPGYRFRSAILSRVSRWNHRWQILTAYQILDERIGDEYRQTLHLPTLGFRFRLRYMAVAVIGNRQLVSLGCEMGCERFMFGVNGFRLRDNTRYDYSVCLNLLLVPSLRCMIQYDIIRQSFGMALVTQTRDWNWWIGVRMHPRLPETMMLRSHVEL
ncbi:MAG: hypothetical protein KBA26_15165 [Candidatus Delongbacteria bacterium]|nr:hypothetical protein [Candidatus Delongbacteria bacterium]